MDVMYYGDTLVVDLDKGKTETVDFDKVAEMGPGLGAGLALYREYAEHEPLVIGSGLLTGTNAPAACLGFVLAESPITGDPAVSPLTGFAGAEMKLSGFAMVVIKGSSSKPVYLWLHDGVADLLDASALWGKDTWETCDAIRHDMGEQLIQVVSIGPAGESSSNLASYSVNYWGSGDTAALGAVMGGKNLKAVAMRGLGMLDAEEPAEFYERSMKLLAESPVEKGFKMVREALKLPDIDAWLKPMVHRYRSCFACPEACNTFVKYNEKPDVMESTDVEEPGMLVTSAAACAWLNSGGWEAEAACRAMEAMARAGVDMMRASRELSSKPLTDPGEIKSAVKALEGGEEAAWPSDPGFAYSWLFGPWVPPIGTEVEWLAANEIGYILGVCPVYLLTAGIDKARLFELCESAAGLEFDSDVIAQMYT